MILALETATTACSAALCAADGAVVAERVSLEGPAHAQRLLPFVHEVFEEAGAGWDEVETIAVGLGPGAFTGLRIGIATARALAHADGRARLAGVPTTTTLALALAQAAPGCRLVALIDGKRHEVFAAAFEADTAGRVRALGDVAVVPADELAAWLTAQGEVVVGGDGAVLYVDLLPASARLAAGVVAPRAAMVGRAVACGAPGLVTGPDAVLPLYGRAPDAKRWSPPAGA